MYLKQTGVKTSTTRHLVLTVSETTERNVRIYEEWKRTLAAELQENGTLGQRGHVITRKIQR